MSIQTYVRNADNTAWVEINRSAGATTNLLRVRNAGNTAWLTTEAFTVKRAWVRNASNTGWDVLWRYVLTTPGAPTNSAFQISPPFSQNCRFNFVSGAVLPGLRIEYQMEYRLVPAAFGLLNQTTLVETDGDDTFDFDPGADGTYEIRSRQRYVDGLGDAGPWSSWSSVHQFDVFT